MKKSIMMSAVLVSFLFLSGNGIAFGQNNSSAPPDQPAATEHIDHASHGAAQPSEKSAEHAGHNMSHEGMNMNHTGMDMGHEGMDDMKQQDDAMAAQMKDMQALMEKISVTENPAERKQMLAEHMTMMANGMKMMREMEGKMMMGMMKSGKCPMMEMMSSPQGHKGMNGMMGNMSMCHSMMQKKAERHYFMLEQMLESQKQLLKLVP